MNDSFSLIFFPQVGFAISTNRIFASFLRMIQVDVEGRYYWPGMV